MGPEEVRLGPGMALTLNGIVQGWAADRIAALVRAAGFQDVLIDMGEIAALGRRPDGRAWQAGIATPAANRSARRRSPTAPWPPAPLWQPAGWGRGPHILGPKGEAPRWETVSISAPQAAVADALSTACCLLPRDGIDRAVSAFHGARLELARPFDRTFLPN
ncbi:FAD:protein FMN transferase [Gemmobacter lanyuensis]